MNEELNKKLAEWAGFQFSRICREPDDWWFEREVYIPPCDNNVMGEMLIPDFTESLDACFKWLVPKLPRFSLTYKYYLTGDTYIAEVWAKSGIHREGYHITNPALALCLAIEKLIDKGMK